MAYENEVVRVTISGTSWGGAEIWSTGFFMGTVGADAPDPTQAWADAVRAGWETFFTAAVPGAFSNAYTTTAVKLSKLDALTGDVQLDKTVYANIQTPITGATGVYNPPQVALVATLLSDTPRGLAAKGRMYLPAPAANVDNTGKISTVVRDAIRTNLATFFTNLNGNANVPADVILASFGRTPPAVGGGVSRLVTSVRVGNVLDTQRRRRNQLVESYASGVVTN